jgi:tRNA U34 2-thiouridine synthase MnmA/TrmU
MVLGVERLEADIRDAAAVLTFLDLKLLETSIQERFWIEIFDAAAAMAPLENYL